MFIIYSSIISSFIWIIDFLSISNGNPKKLHLVVALRLSPKSKYLSCLMHEHEICHLGDTSHNFRFESSKQRQTIRIQTDWRYPQQCSWHRNVGQIYFSGLLSNTLRMLEQHPCYCCWRCKCSERVQTSSPDNLRWRFQFPQSVMGLWTQ
jgi:hypothetical protein